MSVQSTTTHPNNVTPSIAAGENVKTSESKGIQAFEDEDGPSFADFLDVINPLQNLPIIGSIYRYITGDERGAVSTMLGGALYGGPIGMAFAALDVTIKGESGKDIGDNVMTALLGEKEKPAEAGNIMLAKAEETPSSAASVAQESATGAALASNAAVNPVSETGRDKGPIQDGDYLVFGKTPSLAMQAPTSSKIQAPAQISASATNIAEEGEYLLFGAIGTKAAEVSPQIQQETQALQDATNQIQAQQAAQSAILAAGQKVDGARQGMPVPARTGRATPIQSLPPATTGTGAVAGGVSEAVRNARAGGVQKASVTGDPENMRWFSDAFNRAMDRYEQGQSVTEAASASAGVAGSRAKSETSETY